MMKMTFRWYGDHDPVTLDKIRQIPGMYGIVSSLHDIPAGEVWPEERIIEHKNKIEAAGLTFEVVESVPVHESIKIGAPDRDQYIDNYCTTLRRLAKNGVKVVCYNFMPVFDWMRSELNHKLPDGSEALIYVDEIAKTMNPLVEDISLPAWENYDKDELKALLTKYQSVTEEDLWNNLKYFLEKVIKVCDEVKIKMAIHPDDPPWSIFGLPRIIVDETNLDRFLNLVPSVNNGLTLCSGSLGVNPKNNIPEMIRRYGDRIHFMHARNIKITGERCFEEAAHKSECGSLDMYEIIRALYDVGFDGYIRPDHGRMIWGETGQAGYGLFDRALGATYLNGLYEAVVKNNSEK